MSEGPTTPPEGWYPDPQVFGQQRYWDGVQWTDHFAPGPGSSTASGTSSLVVPVASTRPHAAPRPVWGRWWFIAGTGLVLLVVGLGVAGYTGLIKAPPPQPVAATTPTPTQTEPSYDASLACNHFRNVSSDMSKGILTTSEIHTKASQIYSDSAIAPPDVQAAAQEMLAATVADDGTAFLSGMVAMDKACSSAGY